MAASRRVVCLLLPACLVGESVTRGGERLAEEAQRHSFAVSPDGNSEESPSGEGPDAQIRPVRRGGLDAMLGPEITMEDAVDVTSSKETRSREQPGELGVAAVVKGRPQGVIADVNYDQLSGELTRTVDPKYFSVALVILLLFSIIVPFVYMISSKNPELKSISLTFVHTSLCIFVALWASSTTYYVVRHLDSTIVTGTSAVLMDDAVQAFCWYILLQIVLNYTVTASALHTYGTVVAYATGFAFAKLFVECFQVLVENGAGWFVLVLLLAAPVALFLVFNAVSCRIRCQYQLGNNIARRTAAVRGAQGEARKTAWQNKNDVERILGDEEHEWTCAMAEDAAAGIATSFVWAMMLRDACTGVLPDLDGAENASYDVATTRHTSGASRFMVFGSFASIFVATLAGKWAYERHAGHEKPQHRTGPWEYWALIRAEQMFFFSFVFLSAWLLDTAVLWTVQGSFGWPAENLVVRVATSFWGTLLVLVGVRMLVEVIVSMADAHERSWASAMTAWIMSFGVVVGFSWQRAFDRAREDVLIRAGQSYAGEVFEFFGSEVSHFCPDSCIRFLMFGTIIMVLVGVMSLLQILRYLVFPAMLQAELAAGIPSRPLLRPDDDDDEPMSPGRERVYDADTSFGDHGLAKAGPGRAAVYHRGKTEKDDDDSSSEEGLAPPPDPVSPSGRAGLYKAPADAGNPS